MKNKTEFKMKNTFLSRMTMWAASVPFLFSFFACAEKEPIDWDEVDPSINPPYTMDRDDDDEGIVDTEVTGPTFPFFENTPLSFPGGEGYGRNAQGARTTKTREVYRVTNLNDSGEGSFRDAVSKPNRFVVINVDGIVECSRSAVVLSENLTKRLQVMVLYCMEAVSLLVELIIQLFVICVSEWELAVNLEKMLWV